MTRQFARAGAAVLIAVLSIGAASSAVAGQQDETGERDAETGESTTEAEETLTEEAAPEFSAVAAGGYHTCGIYSNGTLACWGENG